MFEIFMLFAFLLAATSQLLPSNDPNNRLMARIKGHGKKSNVDDYKNLQKGWRKTRERQNAGTVIIHMPQNRSRCSNF